MKEHEMAIGVITPSLPAVSAPLSASVQHNVAQGTFSDMLSSAKQSAGTGKESSDNASSGATSAVSSEKNEKGVSTKEDVKPTKKAENVSSDSDVKDVASEETEQDVAFVAAPSDKPQSESNLMHALSKGQERVTAPEGQNPTLPPQAARPGENQQTPLLAELPEAEELASRPSVATTPGASHPSSDANLAKIAQETGASIRIEEAPKTSGTLGAQNASDLTASSVVTTLEAADRQGNSGDQSAKEQNLPSPQNTVQAGSLSAENGAAQIAPERFALQDEIDSLSRPINASIVPETETATLSTSSALQEAALLSEAKNIGPALGARAVPLGQAMEQIRVQIGRGVADGMDTIRMQLHPAELGRIEVRLDMRQGMVQATIIADRQETLQMLRQDAQSLQQALNEAGLNADRDGLSFQLRDQAAEEKNSEQEEALLADAARQEIEEENIIALPLSTGHDEALNIMV